MCYSLWYNTPTMLPATGRQHRGCIIPQALTHSLVLLKYIEEKIRVQWTRRRGRRHKPLLDDLWKQGKHCNLKTDALNSTIWGNVLCVRYGLVTRSIRKTMKVGRKCTGCIWLSICALLSTGVNIRFHTTLRNCWLTKPSLASQ